MLEAPLERAVYCCWMLLVFDLVSLRRTSWYFCLVLRLVHPSSLKFKQLFMALREDTSFLLQHLFRLCSFIKALITNKHLLYVILLNTCPSIVWDCSVSSLNSRKSFSTLSVLHWVESPIFGQIFNIGPRTF